ncbi:hypothetical protein FHX57_006602 [Paraburkholderia tropica]|nr:hypothetical protein [Paraburkholderia tropica]
MISTNEAIHRSTHSNNTAAKRRIDERGMA